MLQEDGSIGLLNACGAHADPVLYHTDMVCHYDSTDSSVHSAIVGVMIDGRGISGRRDGERLYITHLVYSHGRLKHALMVFESALVFSYQLCNAGLFRCFACMQWQALMLPFSCVCPFWSL